ncbi:hypothetical protein ACFL35_17380 [Candidatus Riflebacteria bacterium]
MATKTTVPTALKKLPDPVQDKKTIDVSDDWYTVPQSKGHPPKLVPSAVKLQKLGNEKRISTKVLRIDRDDRGLTVWVKGWIGSEENPEQVKEAVVDVDYQTESIELILAKIQWGKVAYRLEQNANGNVIPVLINKRDQLSLLREMNRKRRFAVRTAITQSEVILNKKLLGFEWRNPEEIATEAHEVDLVNQDMANDNITIESIYYIMGLLGFNRDRVNQRIKTRYNKEPEQLKHAEIMELWGFCQNGGATDAK